MIESTERLRVVGQEKQIGDWKQVIELTKLKGINRENSLVVKTLVNFWTSLAAYNLVSTVKDRVSGAVRGLN